MYIEMTRPHLELARMLLGREDLLIMDTDDCAHRLGVAAGEAV